MTPIERKGIEDLANSLGTFVPGQISIYLVWLPFIKALIKRIEELERKVEGRLE